MRKILFLALLLFVGSSVYSQSEDDFEIFGKEVFEDLVQNDTIKTISYIRLREFREYITKNVEGDNNKNRLTTDVNENLLNRYDVFEKSVLKLRSKYKYELIENASIEYLNTYYFKKDDKLPDSYTFMLSLIYKKGEMQSEIRLQFDAIWHINMFLFISDIKEEF